MKFNRNIQRLGFGADAEQDEIRRLPQFFRGDVDYVYRLGGPFYRSILDRTPFKHDRKFISIDSRVHMLMPGWLPCIGGWHCDDFYRPHRPGGVSQPDLVAVEKDDGLRCQHFSLFAGLTAPTIFADGSFDIPLSQIESKAVYSSIDAHVKFMKMPSFEALSGELIAFDSFDLHRGSPATCHGWRVFVRMTESNHWEPRNEIRTQTQVYLPSMSAGW